MRSRHHDLEEEATVQENAVVRIGRTSARAAFGRPPWPKHNPPAESYTESQFLT